MAKKLLALLLLLGLMMLPVLLLWLSWLAVDTLAFGTPRALCLHWLGCEDAEPIGNATAIILLLISALGWAFFLSVVRALWRMTREGLRRGQHPEDPS